jgi:hypothetical protein
MEYKDRKEALVFLCGEIPNRLDPIQSLKNVAIHLQEYEVAAKLRDMEKQLLEQQKNEINNQE